MGTCGKVEQFHVHQQKSPAGSAATVVRVFVVYSSAEEAAAAMRKMHGRYFAGRQVQVGPYDYDSFSRGMYDS
ncbi:unnamed protein product [Discosporangium mesarthrocarpum]